MSQTIQQIETTPAVDASTEEIVKTSTSSELETLIETLENTLKQLRQQLVTPLKQVKKEILTIEKNMEKSRAKKAQRDAKRKPSGFNKPSIISNELCDFLEIDRGTLLARTEVTKMLSTYIADNNLKNPENRRCILLIGEAGEKLKGILLPVVDDQGNEIDLTFFNIQRYIKHHFKKSSPKKTEEPAQASTSTTTTKTTKKKIGSKKLLSKKTIKPAKTVKA